MLSDSITKWSRVSDPSQSGVSLLESVKPDCSVFTPACGSIINVLCSSRVSSASVVLTFIISWML